MVAMRVLEARVERRVGSSPTWGTKVLYSVILDNTTQGYPCVDTGVLFQLQPNKEAWQSPAYCNSLENCRVERHREFESHRFRQSCISNVMAA